MGLRTASVRRPHVVMAPALTETTQSQGFKLAPKEHFQPVSPINSYKPKSYCLDTRGAFCVGSDELKPFNLDVKPSKSENGIKHVVLQTGKISEDSCLSEVYKASGKLKLNFRDIMNNTPTLMGDQNKMGLQKNGKEPVSYLQKEKTDVEQLLCNFNTDSTSGDCSTGDLTSPPNVDDIMQVITSMEGETDRLGAGNNDLNDVDFSMTGADIANNLLSFEKQLLNDVDMMNISIEDQQEHDNAESIKECRSRDMIAESQRRQARVQRRLDFLKRRVLKFQARLMGQHVSSEVSGVFEHVHQSLKKLKDSSVQEISRPLDASSGSVIPPLPACESYEKFRPLSYGSTKTLARKLEMSTILQANSAARQRHVPKYFGSGSIEPNTFRTSVTGMIAIPPWPTEYKYELQKVSGLLRTELGVVQAEVDSEATDSSSGGESCDEFQNYNNQHQQYLSIQKRALWKYSTERAAIAARWTWLQVQISDLEYRIRQHSELHRQIRSGKGQVVLGGANPSSSVPTSPTTVNGYRGQLPGNSPSSPKIQGGSSSTSDVHPEYQCARTRPLISLKKRKLLQIKGLHIISKKAARPSTTRCGCVPPAAPCAVCTGRTDPTYPRDPPETMSKFERVALLDPSFHPVFSMIEDVSESIHLEAIMKMPEWQQRSARMKSLKGYKSERLDKSTLEHRSKKLEHRKKYGRHLKPSTMSALSAKIKKIRGRKAKHALNRLNRKRVSGDVPSPQTRALSTDGLDEEVESISNNSNNVSRSAGGSPSLSPLLHMQSISGYSKKNRINSYDIDNIVIPYSVAASTRVEKLQYKEILTPKWRIADPDYIPQFEIKNNGSVRSASQDSEPEDLNEDAVSIRHDKCEHDERKKFLSYLKLPVGYGRTRSHKRTDSRAESSGANTPDRMSPHPIDNPENTSPLGSPPATPLSLHIDEQGSLPSISVMRRRTMSQSRFVKDKEVNREDNRCASPETVEVPPFDRRNFPLDDGTYDKMLEHMPEDHQFLTNSRAQDMLEYSSTGYLDTKIGSPGSESTESALAEEDPNDPEWIDVERAARERHKR